MIIYEIHVWMSMFVLQIYAGWWWLPTPLKNMSSSVGMIIPNIWKHKIHVPNHQPVIYESG